jgi:hypothetical protein
MYKLSDIKPLPSFVPNDYYIKHKRKFEYLDDKLVKEDVNNMLPFLTDWNNIILAGGSLSNLIIPCENIPMLDYDYDYDLFFYDITADKAFEKIKSIYELALKSEKELLSEDEKSRTHFTVTKNAITVYYCGYKIQFILKLFKSKEDVINTFDIDASCIGFDGDCVFMNERAKLAFETGYNIINMSKYTPTYPHRLIKYYENKNFGIVLTNFNPNDKNKIQLFDKYTITFEDIKDKKISIKKFCSVSSANGSQYKTPNKWYIKHNDIIPNKWYNESDIISYHNYWQVLVSFMVQDKDYPIIVKEFSNPFTISRDLTGIYYNMLRNNIFSCNKQKIMQFFPDYDPKEVVIAIYDDDKEKVDTIIKTTFDKYKSKLYQSFDLQWDDYINNDPISSTYNFDISFKEFYNN